MGVNDPFIAIHNVSISFQNPAFTEQWKQLIDKINHEPKFSLSWRENKEKKRPPSMNWKEECTAMVVEGKKTIVQNLSYYSA